MCENIISSLVNLHSFRSRKPSQAVHPQILPLLAVLPSATALAIRFCFRFLFGNYKRKVCLRVQSSFIWIVQVHLRSFQATEQIVTNRRDLSSSHFSLAGTRWNAVFSSLEPVDSSSAKGAQYCGDCGCFCASLEVYLSITWPYYSPCFIFIGKYMFVYPKV